MMKERVTKGDIIAQGVGFERQWYIVPINNHGMFIWIIFHWLHSLTVAHFSKLKTKYNLALMISY
jgi:hypothetical protein